MRIDKEKLMAGGDSDFKKEEKVIPKGQQICRLVSYVELGHHYPMFNGKRAVHETGKKTGQPKDEEMHIHLVFEFPHAEYTGDFPLSIKFSSPFQQGETYGLINRLAVSRALETGNLSWKFAIKSNFMKGLLAMQEATGEEYWDMAEFVGTPFLCTVKHNYGKKADEDGNIPVYPKMDLAGLMPTKVKHPVTGKYEEYPCAEQIGDYCPVFKWDEPTEEAVKALPKYLLDYMKTAVDYEGSMLEHIVAGITVPEDQPPETGMPNM